MSFSAQLGRFSAKAGRRAEASRRAVAIKLFSAIIMDTPVLTGRLRGNWQTSLASPIVSEIARSDMSGGEAVRDVMTVVGRSLPTDDMILRNNLPYVNRIEYDGWSHTKAPEGMVRKNVARFHRLFEEAVRENRV